MKNGIRIRIYNLYCRFITLFTSITTKTQINAKEDRWKMFKKMLLIASLCFLALMIVPQVAKAATLTSCVPDKDSYQQGETCVIYVTIYNDEDAEIRVTQLSATIDYYTTDGVRYLQKSFTSAVLPDEIPMGQSTTYQISIELPDNIAPGYTSPKVEGTTEIWRDAFDRWVSSDSLNSDSSTSKPKIYIESEYKQMYENSQQKYQEQVSVSGFLTNMMNVFIVTTIVFACVAGVLFFLMKKPRPVPIPQQ